MGRENIVARFVNTPSSLARRLQRLLVGRFYPFSRCLDGPDGDRDDLNRLVRLVGGILRNFRNRVRNFLSRYDFPEGGVIAVQMFLWSNGDKKLAAVRIRAGISHRQNAGTVELQGRINLVFEFISGRTV